MRLIIYKKVLLMHLQEFTKVKTTNQSPGEVSNAALITAHAHAVHPCHGRLLSFTNS